MALLQQLLTVLVSLIYGSVLYWLIKINKKMLFNGSTLKKMTFSIICIVDIVLIYFIIIKYINNGVLTYYSYLLIILGLLVQNYINNKIKTYKK
jgi:hypothetical protein